MDTDVRLAYDLLQDFIDELIVLFEDGVISLDDAEILRDAAADIRARLRGEP